MSEQPLICLAHNVPLPCRECGGPLFATSPDEPAREEDGVPAQTIDGRAIMLSEGRMVWVGRCDTGGTVLRFVNRRGEITNVALSQEARAALQQLLLEDEELA